MRRSLLFALAAACAVSPNLLRSAPTAVRPKAVFILAAPKLRALYVDVERVKD